MRFLEFVGPALGFGADAALDSGFGFLVILLAARTGSVPEFGQFALILAIVAAQAALAAFGLLTLTYGRATVRWLLGSVMVILAVTTSGLYAVTLTTFAPVGGRESSCPNEVETDRNRVPKAVRRPKVRPNGRERVLWFYFGSSSPMWWGRKRA